MYSVVGRYIVHYETLDAELDLDELTSEDILDAFVHVHDALVQLSSPVVEENYPVAHDDLGVGSRLDIHDHTWLGLPLKDDEDDYRVDVPLKDDNPVAYLVHFEEAWATVLVEHSEEPWHLLEGYLNILVNNRHRYYKVYLVLND